MDTTQLSMHLKNSHQKGLTVLIDFELKSSQLACIAYGLIVAQVSQTAGKQLNEWYEYKSNVGYKRKSQ